MPDDAQNQTPQSNPATQIAWGIGYIRERYGTQGQAPEDVEVTCSGGVQIPPLGVTNG